MSEAPTPPDPTGPPEGPGRSLTRSIVIGVAVAVAVGATVFFLIALPFYTLASFEPDGGVDRPIVRTGLFRIALPVGVTVGLVGGAAAGWWAQRGGTWTVDDGGDRYSNR